MNNDVRKLTDGAMMCAIVGVVLLINRQLGGLFQDMFLFLFPIPMVFYSAKYGMKESWVVFAAMCLLGFFLGGIPTLFYVASESLIGMVYGGGVYAHKDTHKIVLFTMAMGALVNVISTVIFASVFGYDLAAETQEMSDMMTTVFDQSGATIPETVNLTQFIRTIIVVSAILTGVLQGLVTHLLSRLLLKRLRFPIDPPTPLADYYPPKWAGYLGFLGFIAYYYSLLKPLDNQLHQNILQGLGMCGFIYLLAFGFIGIMVYYSIRHNGKVGFGIILGLILMFIMPVALVIFGFLYITTDMHRKLREGTANARAN